MKDSVFVSIIVCLYNQDNTFDYILKILSRQDTSVPYEIILADDGSNLENLSHYFASIKKIEKETDAEIKFVYQPDRGFRLASSRNNALQVANGNIIIMIDGDVIPNNNLIKDHLETHESSKLTLVGTNRKHKHISEVESNEDSKVEDNVARAELEKDTKKVMKKWQGVWGFNMSFSRPLDKKQDILFNDKFFGWGLDDTEFSYRLEKIHGYEIVCNEKVVSYHIHPDVVKNNPYKTLDPADLLKFVNNTILFIEEYDYDDEIVYAVAPTIPKYDADNDVIIKGKGIYLFKEMVNKKIEFNSEQLIKDVYSLKDTLEKRYG